MPRASSHQSAAQIVACPHALVTLRSEFFSSERIRRPIWLLYFCAAMASSRLSNIGIGIRRTATVAAAAAASAAPPGALALEAAFSIEDFARNSSQHDASSIQKQSQSVLCVIVGQMAREATQPGLNLLGDLEEPTSQDVQS